MQTNSFRQGPAAAFQGISGITLSFTTGTDLASLTSDFTSSVSDVPATILVSGNGNPVAVPAWPAWALPIAIGSFAIAAIWAVGRFAPRPSH